MAKQYELPPLPYAYDALEPYIDEQTMRLHHDKHHLGYVNGLNAALEKLAAARASGDYAAVKALSRAAAFHGSGHFLHSVFWPNMAPAGNGGGGEPDGELAAQIVKDFGSFANFKAQFAAASKAVEGSGWGLLVWEPNGGQLEVLQAEKHQNLTQWGVVPLLVIDVWEHAYYLKYQNARGAYVDAFWNIVNWADVAERFKAARG
ncbi:MAG: superoxide dismutase [Anaerolineae bacterium]|nr:superoxide dismutase [Anaerolineae bacterium]